MDSPIRRLSRNEAAQVFAKGRTITAAHITLRFIKKKEPKFLVVVAGHISKTAVERNKIQRRLREATRASLAVHAPLAWGVVAARKTAQGVPSRVLTEELAAVFQTIR